MEDFGLIVISGHHTLDSGGVGTHLRLLIEQIEKTNIKHRIVLGKTRKDAVMIGGIDRLIGRFGTDVRHLSRVFLQAGGLCRVVRDALKSLDTPRVVIHSHDRLSLLGSVLAKSEKVAGLVQTAHAPFAQQYDGVKAGHLLKPMLDGIDTASIKTADHFIAVDQLQEELLRRRVPDAAITEIPNAVNLSMLDDVLAKPAKNDFDRPYLVVARHLYEKCGVHVAVEAFGRCAARKTHYLVLMGDGEQRQMLEERSRALQIADCVKFIGRQPHAKALDIIRNADVSLVPSVPVGDYIEATSITMLESLGMGVPLIASNIGGLKQVLSGTDAGVLLEPSDPDALARAIDEVISNKEKRDVLSRSGRELVESSYGTTSWFERILGVYRTVAAQSKTSGSATC